VLKLNQLISDKFAYDSHVHFFGTGSPAVELSISPEQEEIVVPEHLKDLKLIRGFGWSDRLKEGAFKRLCNHNPDQFFCLSYIDGHTSFVSNNLIEDLKFEVLEGMPIEEVGFLLAETERDQFFKLLPKYSPDELNKMALYAQEIFLSQGINKVRHMTAQLNHWSTLMSLDLASKLKLEIDVFFSEFMGQSLTEAVESMKLAKNDSNKRLKACGIKIFYDGSFGSNTALTSAPGSKHCRINKTELKARMTQILIDHSLEIAVHCIGDQALEDCIKIYDGLSKKVKYNLPKLHLEHAPIFNQKTLQLLENSQLNLVFHFQPSHWIEDINWYNKNSSTLYPHTIYPFDFLQSRGYEFYLGSDSPVVFPSKENMQKGLKLINATKLKYGL
jgi:hypothetical protein